KVFKILSNPYRNRRKRFLLRTTIIAAMINLNLG
ncbi:MAG: IS5/IS1182 family transposase, partial [Christensenellaceae bacterium]|nr:IS5/IS1182 family transposase [Christensenellaceae bacterium]MDR2267386.1 IS5/IS1182 family transposase [Christensenellaceae bacterium]